VRHHQCVNRSSRPQRARNEGGAAAVEFALVSSLLFTLLIAIIQYGLYFNDSISARQGVREAARAAVTKSFPTVAGAPCTTAATTDMDKLRCNAKVQVGALTAAATPSTPAWAKGNALKVCAAVSFNGPINLVPMPNQGWIRTQTMMAVEQDATPLPTGASFEDTLPSGQNWNWCKQPWQP
jgi:Flp pilus assembly protein TadG